MSQRNTLLPFATLLAMSLAAPTLASSPATVKVTPSVVEMGTFYGGTKVRVEGTVPLGSKVVVIIKGEEVTELFNRVGRVGPIWINTGKVSVSGVPSLLLVFSSEPICDCLRRRAMDEWLCDAKAIKKHIQIKPQEEAASSVTEDFLKLKVRQGNYQMSGGGIQIGAATQALHGTASLAMASEDLQTPPPAGGTVPYSLEFTWPKSAAVGTYEIRVHACRDGEVKESSVVPLKVVEIGFPAMITSLARSHASTYGIVSIIIAMLAGFGIDFIASRIFKKKIAAH
jgi:hypothetical protein